MTDPTQFLMKHGTPVLFGAVFVEQMGLPLPALPWMLAVGALSATGAFNSAKGIAVTVLACLVADAIWFYLGRARGSQVLNLLCRISLEPDSCVRRTQNAFSRWGWRGIVVAKFIPGLSTMVPPVAGMSSINAARFLLIDSIGSLLYGACFIYLGFFFSSQIQQIENAAGHIGGSFLCLVLGVVAVYVGYKYWQRKRLLHNLRMTRITVESLRQMQIAGENTVIVDLRSMAELENDPVLIEGAIHLTMDDVKERRYQIPAQSEVVVYCSCPNEVTSARVALLLRRHGFNHVRPLLGGLDAWREQNYPLSKRIVSDTARLAGQARTPN